MKLYHVEVWSDAGEFWVLAKSEEEAENLVRSEYAEGHEFDFNDIRINEVEMEVPGVLKWGE